MERIESSRDRREGYVGVGSIYICILPTEKKGVQKIGGKGNARNRGGEGNKKREWVDNVNRKREEKEKSIGSQ